MKNKNLLKSLSESSGVSGYENNLSEIIKEVFKPYSDKITKDTLGNLTITKWADKKNENSIDLMLAAHMDEIGLMVKSIDENGFIRFTNIGGVDPRTLIAQEVTIHGKEDVIGIIGAKPPHLLSEKEKSKSLELNKLYIDTSLDKEKIEEIITIGDMITLKREFIDLENEIVSGKALDDRAGIVMLYECFKELSYLKTKINVHAVSTVQEEVGVRGANTGTYNIDPDIGIAIDVCHGEMPGVENDLVVDMNKGPAVAFGPHVHQDIFSKMKEIAEDIGIPYQIEPWPHPAGTDAWAIQIAKSGVASALISIPLRYMHTSVETISMKDVNSGGKLLAQFIARIDAEFVEGLRCY